MQSTNGRVTKIRLSPPEIETAAVCAQRLAYQRVWMAQLQSPAAADVFANCVTESAYRYLLAQARSARPPSPWEHFGERWQEYLSHTALHYESGQSAGRYERLGLGLMRRLPAAWGSTRLKVARDRAGEALINVPMRADLGSLGGIDLELAGTLGILAESPGGTLKLLQLACETSPDDLRQARRAGLLTGYQELVEHNRGARGLGKVQEVGFWDFLIDPIVHIARPAFIPARPPIERRLYGERAWRLAEEIHRGSFPHNSHGAQRMPCVQCAYVHHCRRGDPSGLRFLNPPPPPPKAKGVRAPA